MTASLPDQSRVRRTPAATVDPATSTVVKVLGVLAGAVGVEHGIGDLAQGWRAPPGLTFSSWPDSPAFQALQGEPAMSVVPNLALSGLLSITVAIVLGLFCLTSTHRPRAGWVITALSVVLLLVGGGFGPPALGLILAVTATRIGTLPRRRPGRLTRHLARLRWWALGVAVLGFLALFPGIVMLSEQLPPDPAALVSATTATAFAGLAASIVTARAHDHLRRWSNVQ